MSGSDGDQVAVLIPAAGQGTRLGGKRKQFRLLGGRPLLVQTLSAFEHHAGVHHIVVAAPREAVQSLEEMLRAAGMTKLAAVVAGGRTRQESVGAALRVVPPSVKVVLVHDAVRPFVRSEHISGVIEAVQARGAAALAVPVTDTVRRGANNLFGETVPRPGLFAMQTPQGFRRDWFEEAHAEAARRSVVATDDVDLVQRIGRPVHIVPGSTHNIKITTPADWELAALLWSHWSAQALRSGG